MSHSEMIAKIRSRLSVNALQTLAAAGMDSDEVISSDIAAIQAGTAPTALLDTCLDGAESPDVVAGWTEYVEAIEHAMCL